MNRMRFCMKILTSEVYEGRLLRKVAKGYGSRTCMAKCMRDFEWQDMGVVCSSRI